LVEDISPIDTAFTNAPPVPLAADLPEHQVITFGSASKLFWGGLRVGWLRAAPHVIDRLAIARSSMDLSGSLVSQAVVSKLLPHALHARDLRRSQLLANYEHVTELLTELLPQWSWDQPQGGASLWVKLPHPDALSLAASAMKNGVRLTPGPTFSATGGLTDRIRISFSNNAVDRAEGLGRLAEAWNSMRVK
jgi:DNA-binding transcriptional MocR family regulator